MNLSEKTIAVTGGNGFLGSHVCEALEKRHMINSGELHHTLDSLSAKLPNHFSVCRSANFNLTLPDRVKAFYEAAKPDIVIHMAAIVGGIGANRAKPATFYYHNLMMNTLLIEHAKQNNIDKFVAIGSMCSYPKHTPIPFKEENLWDGYPEETNAPYAIAKKAMLVQAQAYRTEHGLNSIYLIPINLYGPRDNFDLNTSHVIPALIKKCVHARDNNNTSITCWGTGTATREFLYVEDAADAIVLATEKYDGADPINIGIGTEISIAELMDKIVKLTNYDGQIVWDISYPDGQPRRSADVSKAEKLFGFKAKVSLDEGLAKTVEWYERNKHAY